MVKRAKNESISIADKEKLVNNCLKQLTAFPSEFFGSYWLIFNKLKENFTSGKPVRDLDIALCYYGLYESMCSGNIKHKTPIIEEKHDRQHGDFYEHFDEINPENNFYYTCVYKRNFSLPKTHKNVFFNKKPQTSVIFFKPKPGIKFNIAERLFFDFIRTAEKPLGFFDVKDYIADAEKYIVMPNYLQPNYLEKSYKALKRLLTKADLTYIYTDVRLKPKGSVVLARELNTLLSNQNIIENKAFEKRIIPYKSEQILADVRDHKKAMFGELKHDYEKFHKIKEIWRQKQK